MSTKGFAVRFSYEQWTVIENALKLYKCKLEDDLDYYEQMGMWGTSPERLTEDKLKDCDDIIYKLNYEWGG